MSSLTSRGPGVLWGAIAAIVAVIVVGVAIVLIDSWHLIPQTPTGIDDAVETTLPAEDAEQTTPTGGDPLADLPGLGAIGGPGLGGEEPQYLPPVEPDVLGGTGNMGADTPAGAER